MGAGTTPAGRRDPLGGGAAPARRREHPCCRRYHACWAAGSYPVWLIIILRRIRCGCMSLDRQPLPARVQCHSTVRQHRPQMVNACHDPTSNCIAFGAVHCAVSRVYLHPISFPLVRDFSFSGIGDVRIKRLHDLTQCIRFHLLQWRHAAKLCHCPELLNIGGWGHGGIVLIL